MAALSQRGFILEEGLPIVTLHRMATSMREAAAAAGVRLVTGDTKVVGRGKADGMFINTAGVGRIIAPAAVEPNTEVMELAFNLEITTQPYCILPLTP